MHRPRRRLRMSKSWGESFLKSGLPLEHLTAVTLRSMGWLCYPNFEYERPNARGKLTNFDVDLSASMSARNRGTSLQLLIECKYHDASRFWIFHPQVRPRWAFNDRVYNIGPLQTMRPEERGRAAIDKPSRPNDVLQLAALSYGGVVVSQDGQKQENALDTAISQLAY